MSIQADTTNHSVYIRILDSGDGTPEQAVEASNLTAYFNRMTGTLNAIAVTDLATLTEAHTNGGFFHVDDGYYRLDVPDEAYATGASQALVAGNVSGMVVIGDMWEIVTNDPNPLVESAATVAVAVRVEMDSNSVEMASLVVAAASIVVAVIDDAAATNIAADIADLNDAVGNIAIAGGAINQMMTTYVLTTGTQSTNTSADTKTVNGVAHEHTDDSGDLNLYYEFAIGGDGVPTGAVITGYVNGSGDNITIYAYDWGNTVWDQVGVINGKNQTTNDEHGFALLTGHVGTGANIGTVRVRFDAAGLSSATLAVDQIFVEYVVVARSVGYANGAIWVNTSLSNENTESYVDGTADNPVSTWAAALTLSGQLNIERFEIANGSTITLTGNSDNYVLLGKEWTLALGGVSCDDAYFEGAHVTGTCTGGEVVFTCCDLASGGGTLTCAGLEAHRCALAGSIVLTAANDYFLDQCYSGIAGTSTPDIDTGVAVANVNLNMRHYSGGVEVKNLGQSGTDNMSLEGWGQLTVNANCTGGTIAVRGNFKVTDNGSASIVELARFSASLVATQSDAASLIAAVITDAAGTNVSADVAAVKVETASLVAAAITDAAGTNVSADIAAVKVETASLVVAAITDAANTNVSADVVEVKTQLDVIQTDTTLIAPQFASLVVAVITDAANTNVAADVVEVKTQLDVIQADTTLIAPQFASLVAAVITDAAGTNVSADVAAVKVETASLVVAAIDDAAATNVAADVVAVKTQLDVIQADTTLIVAASAIASAIKDMTFSELAQAAPDATPSLEAAIMLLYQSLAQKRITTDIEDGIHNAAGVKVAKAPISAASNVLTRDKFGSGA